MGKVLPTLLPFISHKLLDAIGWDLANQWLVLGDLVDPNGRKIEGYSTLEGKHMINVRGENPFPSCDCKK